MLTTQQVAALKYLIFKAEPQAGSVGDLTKRILAFLIDQSDGLTKDVCVTLWDGRDGFTGAEIGHAALFEGRFHSCNCTTHLNVLMVLSGAEDVRFDCHYGHPNNGEFDTLGQFPGFDPAQTGGVVHPKDAPIRYTFWLSKGFYSRTATQIPVTREMLNAIDLAKPGLYPELENQKISA